MNGRPIVGLVPVLLLVAACGGQAAPNSPSTVATAPPGATSAASANATELEGVWHTGVVTPDDMRAVLQAAGLQEHIQPFFAFWKPGDENVFTLRIGDGRWALYWSKEGGPALEEDSGAYTIDGDTVTIRHADTGTDTHRWSVDGDVLTLAYLHDTFTGPIPRGEEVYQRILYMSSPWTRGKP